MCVHMCMCDFDSLMLSILPRFGLDDMRKLGSRGRGQCTVRKK